MDYLINRICSSFLSGLIISQTGSLIQLGTRNILASPSTLGFDGLTVLWLLISHSILLAINLNFSSYHLLLLGLPLFLILGLFFARKFKGSEKFERIILLGLTFNLLVGAIFSLWQFFFMAYNIPFPVELWFGHFRFSGSSETWILLVVEILILMSLKFGWHELMVFSLGYDIGQNFQLNEKKLFSILFVIVSIGTFVVICLFGSFSFLGLIFPIVSRKLWFKKFDFKGEVLWGAILNGLILSFIDFLCYLLPIWGAELPVGLIVTVIGAVSLILLLWKSQSPESLAKSTK